MKSALSKPGIAVALALAWLTVSLHAGDWPWWRGPERTGVVQESSGWPEGWPPRQLWKRQVGFGCTSPVIAQGRLYVMGWAGGDGRRPGKNETGTDTLYCLDAQTGKELWKQAYPCRYQGRLRTGDTNAYGGPSATPTLDLEHGRIYTLGVDGDLRCWDVKADGKLAWTRNLYDDFPIEQRPNVGGGRRDFGFPTAPLLHGGQLIVEVGAVEGLVMAFDPATGNQLWTSQAREPAGHTGCPVPFRVGKTEYLAVLALKQLVVMHLDPGRQGRTAGSFAWQTEFACNIATPAVAGDRLVVTSGYNRKASAALHLTPTGLSQLWQSPQHAVVGSPVVHRGRAYLVNNAVRCVDLASGRDLWQGGVFGHGTCLVTAPDNRLIVFGKGRLALLEAGPQTGQYTQLGRIDGVARGICYPQVTLSDGILACKDRDGSLVCFSLRPGDRPTTPTPPDLHDGPAPNLSTSWPGSDTGLLFAWRKGGGLGPGTHLEARGKAHLAPDGSMELSGGGITVQGVDEQLLAQCRQSNQLTIEALITPGNVTQGGPARIVSFSTDPYRRNVTLGQEKDRFVLRLRTPQTGENGMKPQTTLCAARPGVAQHLVIAYSPGRLVCYLDGTRVLDTDTVRGDFSNWGPQHLLFGDEWADKRDWAGRLSAVAIHSRVVGAEEAALRFGMLRETKQ